MAQIPKPPYDAELIAVFEQLGAPHTFSLEMLPAVQQGLTAASTAETVIAATSYAHEEITIPGPGGDIILSVFRPKGGASPKGGRPAIYFVHGGGMVLGDRFTGVVAGVKWASSCGAICISVEYRLAPQHPAPAQIDDCYAGLKWVGGHLKDLGIDPARLMVAGSSAGGNFAAALALRVRDQGGPKLCAQLLDCPMMDDRMESVSSKQYLAEGSWSRGSNLMAWKAVLGDRLGGPNVSIYEAPGRATDLSNLPPAFICAGSAELFRDECVSYATRLWACGTQAELHVWAGGFHTFETMAPNAKVSIQAFEAQKKWAMRMLLQENDKQISSNL
jgi:acetyl esterase/lipase